MTADIEEGADHSGGVADDQHRVFAHRGREEIAGLRDLAVMAQEQPAAREDALQFLAVDLRLDKDAAADQAALVIDETRDIARHTGLLNRLPRLSPSSRLPSAGPSGDRTGDDCSRCSDGRWPRPLDRR